MAAILPSSHAAFVRCGPGDDDDDETPIGDPDDDEDYGDDDEDDDEDDEDTLWARASWGAGAPCPARAAQ